MPRPVVFVDTNAVDNKSSATSFLGGRADLEKIAKRADIKLPRIVLDEIRKHIRSYLIGQRKSFRTNPHRHLLGISDESIEAIDHNALLDKLVNTESISFEVVELSNELSVYKEIYLHALEGTPPYEPSGDKGFKDALIAKTIDQFVSEHPDLKVFLWTGDGRLSDYFTNTTVQVIDGYQEFDREYSEDKMKENLLLDRIWVYFNEEGLKISTSREPYDQWLNDEGDIVCLFREPGRQIFLLVDSGAREPLSYTELVPANAIGQLRAVSSFSGAHDAIAEMEALFAYCSIEQIKLIAEIMTTNSQIYGIGIDDDIAQFAERLFHALDKNGESELAETVRSKYELRLLTEIQIAELPF